MLFQGKDVLPNKACAPLVDQGSPIREDIGNDKADANQPSTILPASDSKHQMSEVITSSQKPLVSTSSSVSLSNSSVQSQECLPFYSKLNFQDVVGECSMTRDDTNNLVSSCVFTSPVATDNKRIPS